MKTVEEKIINRSQNQKQAKSDNNQLLCCIRLKVNNQQVKREKSMGKQMKSNQLCTENFQITLKNLLSKHKRKQFSKPYQFDYQKDDLQGRFLFKASKNYKRYSHVKDRHRYNIELIESKLQNQKPIKVQNQNALTYFKYSINAKSQILKRSKENNKYWQTFNNHSPQSVKSNNSYDLSRIKQRIEKFLQQEDDTVTKQAKSFNKQIFDASKNRHKKGVKDYLHKSHLKSVNMKSLGFQNKRAKFQQVYKQSMRRNSQQNIQQPNITSTQWLKNKKTFSIKQIKLKRKGCNPYSVDEQHSKNIVQNDYYKVVYFKAKKEDVPDDGTADQNFQLSVINGRQQNKFDQNQLVKQNKTGEIIYKNKGSTIYLNYPSFGSESQRKKRHSMGDSGVRLKQTLDGNYIEPWQDYIEHQDHLLASHNDDHIFSTKFRSHQDRKKQ